MKSVRVVFFADILTEGFDGAVRTMYQIINRIDNTAFEYLFVYGVGPDQILGFESLKIPAVALPVNTTYSMALPVLAQTKLKRTLQAFSPDVVHIATPSLLGNFALNYSIQNRLPVITIYHTHFISYVEYYFRHAQFLINKVRNRMVENQKGFYNRCDKVYVPADSIRQELAGIGIEKEKMQLWRRGVDTNLFTPLKRSEALMLQLTGNSNPTILFASRLVWEKNLKTLFEIYDAIYAYNMNINFVIAGDGIARTACEERMPNAIFTGNIGHEKLSALYASADVFVFPSISETYGNVVLEAMVSGLPCVIADGGGSKDFIDQGVNGFKCEPNNAADYAEKINLILTNYMLRDQFKQRGLKYRHQLSWDQLAQQYFDDITDLAYQHLPQLAAAV
jgi:glycosyltransferase involved in cell wall biosynthesis